MPPTPQPEPTEKRRRDKNAYIGEGQVNSLRRRGILMGVGSWDIADKNITRRELAVLLDRILVLPNTIDFNHFCYKDVPRSSFAYHSIEKLCYFDIIQGENKNNFKPQDTVSVADIAFILDLLEYYEYPLNPNKQIELNGEPILDPR